MKQYRLLFLMILLLVALLTFPIQAQVLQQDAPDTPPEGYLDSCQDNPILFEYFGPNCLNPVRWNLSGFLPIGTWIYFTDDETGLNDMGLIQGYTWDLETARYLYYVMTQMPMFDQGFGGAFEDVPAETIIAVEIAS